MEEEPIRSLARDNEVKEHGALHPGEMCGNVSSSSGQELLRLTKQVVEAVQPDRNHAPGGYA